MIHQPRRRKLKKIINNVCVTSFNVRKSTRKNYVKKITNMHILSCIIELNNIVSIVKTFAIICAQLFFSFYRDI